MGKERVMYPVSEVNLETVKYVPENIQAPHLTGLGLQLFVKLAEAPAIGSLIMARLKNQNRIVEMLKNTVIPEAPMFKPEFTPQEPECCVSLLEEDGSPQDRVGIAFNCLPHNDPASNWTSDMTVSFRYWKIRDYAHAYRSKLTTPSLVAECFISAMEEFDNKNPTAPLLISFNPDEVRKQAAASTQRFEDGNPLSILDGIFVAIKDDIDLYHHPTKGATTWYHEVYKVEKDAISVSRLRCCGVILVGKANMHELGLGTTGNNPNYGTTRNPHAPKRYTGGSSSGPAAIVASGLCSAALGTDGGGSIRIPSSLCGVVGLKTTYGRTDMRGAMCGAGTVEIIGPITATVEDAILVYSAILGSSPADKISLKPQSVHAILDAIFIMGHPETVSLCFSTGGQPCVPNLSSNESLDVLGSMRLGKYTEWFNDVFSPEISEKCEGVLHQLSKKYGCKVIEIVIPELHEMRTAHIVSIGSESLCSLNPYLEGGKGARLTHDTRTNLALFRSFTASDYVAAQRLRRRLMYYHMEIFKNVDVIVTATTGMTAPIIPASALAAGESNLQVSGNLMRFIITANLLGLPAISVPIGYDMQGLPIGIQLIGRPWCEASILHLAAAIEENCSSPKRKPLQFYDILKGGN